MGDDEAGVVAFPRPASGSRTNKVEAEKKKPEVEPRRTVDVGPGYAGVEPGLEKRGSGADASEGYEE
jgi:hypothetical protein